MAEWRLAWANSSLYRNREIGGEELEVIVTKMEDGERRSYRVPQAEVDAAYDGSAKKLKTHLNELADL